MPRYIGDRRGANRSRRIRTGAAAWVAGLTPLGAVTASQQPLIAVDERCRVSSGEGRVRDPVSRRYAARATGWALMHPARPRTSGGPRVRVVSSLHAAATVPLARPALVPSVGSVGAAVGVATTTAAAAASALPIHGGGVSAGWTDQSREHDAVGAQRGGHAGRAGSLDAPAMGIGDRAAPGRAGAGAGAAR